MAGLVLSEPSLECCYCRYIEGVHTDVDVDY